MPQDSFAMCFCGKSTFGVYRSSTGVFLPDFPSGVSGEKTQNGVKLTSTAGNNGWLAIVYS